MTRGSFWMMLRRRPRRTKWHLFHRVYRCGYPLAMSATELDGWTVDLGVFVFGWKRRDDRGPT